MRVLSALLLPLLFLASGLWLEYQRFLQTPLPIPEGEPPFEIPQGASLRTIAEQLVSRGILKQPYFWMALAFLRGDATRIQAGEYPLVPGMKPAQLLDRLVTGRVVQRSVTLIEGWTLAQALAQVAANPDLRHTLNPPTPEGLMAALGHPDRSGEGRFLPDTYYVTKGDRDVDLFRRAYVAMERFLAREWPERAPGLPLETAEEALILASIVEKETGRAEERPLIAGVFIQRLRKGMRLQTDPTVIYGLGAAFDGNLRRSDLRRDTPYNTYLHGGLPPTPIALPGRAAIRAVLHPQEENYLYFVAKGDGSHQFSATLEEHNRAVRRYQRKP